MLNIRRLFIALLVALFNCAPGHACMSHKIYAGFWKSIPQQLRPGEVALEVRYLGWGRIAYPHQYSELSRANGSPASATDDESPEGPEVENPFRSSCKGATYLFEVVDVIGELFAPKEIAIVLPMIGEFLNEPHTNETRFVVGVPLGEISLEQRWTGNAEWKAAAGAAIDRAEESLGVPYDEWYRTSTLTWEQLESASAMIPPPPDPGYGPLTVVAIAPRAPLADKIWVGDLFGPRYICDPMLEEQYGMNCPR